MKPTIINFEPLGDARGSLVAIESDIGIPFPIRRVYYIFGTKEAWNVAFTLTKIFSKLRSR